MWPHGCTGMEQGQSPQCFGNRSLREAREHLSQPTPSFAKLTLCHMRCYLLELSIAAALLGCLKLARISQHTAESSLCSLNATISPVKSFQPLLCY